MRNTPVPPVLKNTRESWQEVQNYLLRAGAQAPSWYNCQPWKFRTGEDWIEIFLDEEADQTFYNWNQFHSLLACGAAIENIMIAAEARGLKPSIQTFPNLSDPTSLTRITLNVQPQASPTGESLEKAIWTRHTNTLFFENTLLSDSERRAIRVSIQENPKVALHLLETPEERRRAYEATSWAEQLRFSRRDLHEYLHRMIRWNETDALSQKTGLTLPSMGACGFGEVFFRVTRPWPLMRIMNLFGAYRDQARRANDGLNHCAAVGLLTFREKNKADLMSAGRSLQKLWLTSTRLGLDLQPHSTITLFHWAWIFGGPALYRPHERRILERAFRLYSEAFPAAMLGEKEVGFFLFRIGRGQPAQGFTLRKEITL